MTALPDNNDDNEATQPVTALPSMDEITEIYMLSFAVFIIAASAFGFSMALYE